MKGRATTLRREIQNKKTAPLEDQEELAQSD